MLRIREMRTARKISQETLANYIGVTQATLSGWETGKYDIDNQSLAKCAEYFGVTTGYLLGLEQEKFYSADVSHKMCAEITHIRQEQPEKFAHFLVPSEVWKQIQDGTYPFSDITFKQFSDVIGKTAADYLLDETDEKSPAPGEAQNGEKKNVVRTIGRDGSYEERYLTDEQLEALKAVIRQMPKVEDDF